jgi:hypothetical protein
MNTVIHITSTFRSCLSVREIYKIVSCVLKQVRDSGCENLCNGVTSAYRSGLHVNIHTMGSRELP